MGLIRPEKRKTGKIAQDHEDNGQNGDDRCGCREASAFIKRGLLFYIPRRSPQTVDRRGGQKAEKEGIVAEGACEVAPEQVQQHALPAAARAGKAGEL